uniref:Venom protein-5 n=1 Tax=Mesobuthus eupeus TaxID=34648 RepID=E4VP54_MESEU|nr:venom protein-5 [Mesobuthus eupeus]
MNFLAYFFLFVCFLSICSCNIYYSYCPSDLLERYCALKERETVLECIRNAENDRPFEILEGCYNSVHELGTLTLDDKLKQVCNLDVHEYELLRKCFQNGMYLERKRGSKAYTLTEDCISKTEVTEKKDCRRRGFHAYVHFGKWY